MSMSFSKEPLNQFIYDDSESESYYSPNHNPADVNNINVEKTKRKALTAPLHY